MLADEYLKSDMKVGDVDPHQLGVYIAVNMTSAEIRLDGLHNIVPRRRYDKGPRPGVGGKEARAKGRVDEEDSQWVPVRRELTEYEVRMLVAKCLEIAVRASFELHVYRFGGKVYRQRKGGLIGSRLTMAVARIVMLIWGRLMRGVFTAADIQILLAVCYVDDLRYILTFLPLYITWDEKGKVWKDARGRQGMETRLTGLEDMREESTMTWDKKSKR